MRIAVHSCFTAENVLLERSFVLFRITITNKFSGVTGDRFSQFKKIDFEEPLKVSCFCLLTHGFNEKTITELSFRKIS